MVHVTDPPVLQSELAGRLRPGDVFCHLYHDRGNTIFENGGIPPALWEARERGVLFDCCHGSANFSFPVAEKAVEAGFLPDIISPVEFVDTEGERRNGRQLVLPMATLLDGVLAWRSQELCG